MKKLLQALGYVPESYAVAHGFTNHASFLGIPCWIQDAETDDPLLWAKWSPMEYLIPLFAAVGALVRPEAGGWPIHIGPSIGAAHAR